MLAVTHGALAYYALLVSWALVAIASIRPRRRGRRLYLRCGTQTPVVKPGTTLHYGAIGGGPDTPETGAAPRAGSPSPRPRGTPGNATYPPPADTTTHTTHPCISNGASQSTVWSISDDGAASSMLTYGSSGGSAA